MQKILKFTFFWRVEFWLLLLAQWLRNWYCWKLQACGHRWNSTTKTVKTEMAADAIKTYYSSQQLFRQTFRDSLTRFNGIVAHIASAGMCSFFCKKKGRSHRNTVGYICRQFRVTRFRLTSIQLHVKIQLLFDRTLSIR